MSARVRNKVYLKKNFESGLYYVRVFELLKVLIPNYKRIYNDFEKYYEAAIKIDEFDDKLYHFIDYTGFTTKIKEVANGIWMTREARGVCYFYEPKGLITQRINEVRG